MVSVQGEQTEGTDRRLREMNEALLISSVRQHELAEQARAAEAALRQTERRYHALFDLSPVAVYSCDASGVIQEYNRRAAELWGRIPEPGDPDERYCGSLRMICPDGSVLAHDQCPMADVLCGAIPYARDAEVGIERPDGSRITVVVNIRPLKNEQGEITGAINCFYDITERKEMEQRLRDSEERYRAVTAEVKDYAIFRIDPQGRALTWNQGVARIFGFEEADFLNHDILELIFTPEDVRSGDAQRELDTAAAKGNAGDDRWMRRRNGERFFANGVTTALKNDRGDLIGFTKVMRDVTEQRQMQNQIEYQAERLADESRRKDEFLAMLSHELRNPLASIVNATQLLRLQQDRNPIQVQAQAVIDRQVAQLAHLVDDLLEVSRISTGRIHLSSERVDLRGTILSAIETIQPQANRKEHSLVESLPEEPVWVEGDPLRLEQVVVNLLNNAVKYTDASGHIGVTLQREGNEALLRVRDDGVGIAPEMLPRIFDLFTQADESLDRAQGGLGIGLALVKSLVTLHRGRVEAQSTLGEGSEFTIALPLLQSQEPHPIQSAAEAITSDHALKVLVVDDNKDAADTVSMLLQALGHDVRLAHDGKVALKTALDYRPDVILLDIGLPGADGFQVATWIRQEPALKDVLLIALTGYGRESDRQRSRDVGFNYHLVKPIDFSKIESLLSAATNADAPDGQGAR